MTQRIRAMGLAVLHATAFAAPALAAPDGYETRLREVTYDPHAVVTVPVKRGVVTLITLGADESISEVATGMGSDCAKPEAAWCVTAQPGGRNLFVKPKSSATEANNLAIVTDRRSHSIRLVVLDDRSGDQPVYRLLIKAPQPKAPLPAANQPPAIPAELSSLLNLPAPPALPSAQELVAERLEAMPTVRNTSYSIAEGKASADIVPSLVFDDGRFTYLRFLGNRELPAVFQVLGDASETLVNTRMEGDLVVVDRVSRRLMLRAGNAVVGIWNDAFDADGRPPAEGTSVPGVRRILKAPQSIPSHTTAAEKTSP